MKLGHLLTTKVKQWTGKAFDAKTKEILGVYIGDRSESALKLWNSLPPVYRKCAVCYTDFWDADQEVIPAKRHKAVGKIVAKLIVLKIQ